MAATSRAPKVSALAMAGLGAAGVISPTLTTLALLIVQGVASGVASERRARS